MVIIIIIIIIVPGTWYHDVREDWNVFTVTFKSFPLK